MPRIFISYRRADSSYPAHSIYDKLVEHFGKESVVFDVDSIPKGFDFVEYLDDQVQQCDVLLAVIGTRWLDVKPDATGPTDGWFEIGAHRIDPTVAHDQRAGCLPSRAVVDRRPHESHDVRRRLFRRISVHGPARG